AVHGHNGLTYGQCVGLRYSPSAGIAVAIGMNAMLAHIRDLVIDTLCAELGARGRERPAPSLGFELGELEGRYVGPGSSSVVALCDGDRLAVEIERAGHRLAVEILVDDAGKPIVRSPIPQLSMGFFR